MTLGADLGQVGGVSEWADDPSRAPRTPAKPPPRGSFVQYFRDLRFPPDRPILGGSDPSGFGASRIREGAASDRYHWTYVHRGVYRGVRVEVGERVGREGWFGPETG